MNRRKITKEDSTIEKKEHNSINTDLIKSPSLEYIDSREKTIEKKQQIKPREIKEVMKKDISDDSKHVHEATFVEKVGNERGFFSKVFRKLSTALRKDN